MKEFNLNQENPSPSASKKLKVLVSAYACEPDKGSELGVGWNWAKQIARFHEVWVITRANNREPIEKELQKNPISNLNFIYVDLLKWLSFWKSGQRGIYSYYYFWQLKVLVKGLQLHRKVKFDLAHHITFGNCWMPATLSLMPIPFVWGPIGGAQKAPTSLVRHLKILNILYELYKCLNENALFLKSIGVVLRLLKSFLAIWR